MEAFPSRSRRLNQLQDRSSTPMDKVCHLKSCSSSSSIRQLIQGSKYRMRRELNKVNQQRKRTLIHTLTRLKCNRWGHISHLQHRKPMVTLLSKVEEVLLRPFLRSSLSSLHTGLNQFRILMVSHQFSLIHTDSLPNKSTCKESRTRTSKFRPNFSKCSRPMNNRCKSIRKRMICLLKEQASDILCKRRIV